LPLGTNLNGPRVASELYRRLGLLEKPLRSPRRRPARCRRRLLPRLRHRDLRNSQRLAPDRQQQRAADAVGQVIVRARRMVDAVAPAARSAALEPDELRSQARIVEQLAAAAVQDRQDVSVQIALDLLADQILDTVRAETLAATRPRTGRRSPSAPDNFSAAPRTRAPRYRAQTAAGARVRSRAPPGHPYRDAQSPMSSNPPSRPTDRRSRRS
jgi:hypothetical protein